jgi:PPM family protein phosphatase
MIKTDNGHLHIEAASHPGITGKQNEDRYKVTSFLAGHQQQKPSVLAVLCDGIGGHRAGEVAAEMGVTVITEIVAEGDIRQPLKVLKKAITTASDEIYNASQTDQGRSGMGATCVIAWVIDGRLYTANLGDSRIYLLRDGHIVQLSTDHTWIQEALDAGIITDADRENHPNAHVIRRYLGSKNAPRPDFRLWYFEGEQDADALENQGLPLIPGDILLLCSDGLTDLVTDEEIRQVIEDTPLAQAPQELIDLANRRGGHDNTTIVVLSMPTGHRDTPVSTKKRRYWIGCLAAFAIISALVTAFFFGGQRWQWSPSITGTAPLAVTEALPTEPTGTQRVPTQTLAVDLTVTPEPPVELESPRYTITPWPTHTQAP